MTVDPRRLGLSEQDLLALGYTVRDGRREAGGAPAPTAVVGSGPKGARVRNVRARGVRTWCWTVVILIGGAWASSAGRQATGNVAANRPDTVFSSGRAMAQLVEVARAPRPSGSVEHTRVAGLLRQRLSDLGFAEGPEPFDRVHTVLSGLDGADATRVDNVVARLEGTASTGAILVVAHYDTKPTTPGAGDGGIGVAAVLEALRALTLSTPLRNDVIVLLADGGALGDLGVRAFLEGHPWSSEVSLADRAVELIAHLQQCLADGSPDAPSLP